MGPGARRLLSLALAAWLPAGLSTDPAQSAMYYCMDASGRPIFTDNPSQLEACVLLQGDRAAAAPAPAPPRLPPDEPPAMAPLPPDHQDDAQAAVPRSVRVPIGRSGKSLIVQVRLNGIKDARLILDTGADITILSHALALDLGLFPSAAGPTVTLNTVGGQVRADVIRVGSVSVGAAEARDVLAVIHDLPDAPTGIDGLLGLTFLDKFVVTVDAQKGELQLSRRD